MMKNQEETNFLPLTEKTFKFRCHKGISCFTECCADLNLILMPYDIIRLKSRLGITSDEFIEKYTEPKLDEAYRFPVIRLLMNEDERRACPFVTKDGCSVYEDRPGACRIYPLGRAALSLENPKERAREKFFLVQESHCKGFLEDKEWTIEAWLSNEGLDEYNAMNDQWLRVLTSRKNIGEKHEIPRKLQMFYLASYNIDKFREFVFKGRFFDRFEVDDQTREKIASDDSALMLFAIGWLWFALFGLDTMKVRQ